MNKDIHESLNPLLLTPHPSRLCVIGGAGYVGLITSIGFAELGHYVISVDLNTERIEMLQVGRSPIYEDGLEPLLRGNLEAGRLRFSSDLAEAVFRSEGACP